MLRLFSLIAAALLSASWAGAETVQVKYRGAIDLKEFTCQDITRSSFINRVCYDDCNQYMIVQLQTVYYHYCELPKATLTAFLNASSMGQHRGAQAKMGRLRLPDSSRPELLGRPCQ